MKHWWHAQREQLQHLAATWPDPDTGEWHRGVVTYSLRSCSCCDQTTRRLIARRSIEQLQPATPAPNPSPVDPTTGMRRSR